MKPFIAITAAALLSASAAFAGETPSPDGASVYFINLEDGQSVQSPVTVLFGLKGMGVAPASTEAANTGHHHILIDRAPYGEGAEDADIAAYGIPADDNHKHFGKGQTQTALDLAPGMHTLQLVLGDLAHIPHDTPVVSPRITINVTE